jgi:hypothetical protein
MSAIDHSKHNPEEHARHMMGLPVAASPVIQQKGIQKVEQEMSKTAPPNAPAPANADSAIDHSKHTPEEHSRHMMGLPVAASPVIQQKGIQKVEQEMSKTTAPNAPPLVDHSKHTPEEHARFMMNNPNNQTPVGFPPSPIPQQTVMAPTAAGLPPRFFFQPFRRPRARGRRRRGRRRGRGRRFRRFK